MFVWYVNDLTLGTKPFTRIFHSRHEGIFPKSDTFSDSLDPRFRFNGQFCEYSRKKSFRNCISDDNNRPRVKKNKITLSAHLMTFRSVVKTKLTRELREIT